MVKQCRICRSKNLQPVIDLGMQALSGHFPLPNKKVPEAPLKLIRCQDCGLVQLNDTYNLKKMYGQNYGYRSGLNKSMVFHLRDIVNDTLKIAGQPRANLIIDIGSNDGTLLSYYPKENMLIGIDPTSDKFAKYYKPWIKHYPKFFSAKLVKSMFPTVKAKIITSIAMFYDLESPMDFMAQVCEILDTEGVWVIEQSYMPAMIRNTLYDTICHEHIEYYGLTQIKYMADRCGLKIIDVKFNDTNGGSFKVVMAKKDSKYKEYTGMDKILAEEAEMVEEDMFNKFAEKVKEHKKQLLAVLAKYKNQGKTILGYGASTKGNVMLAYCGITSKIIPYIGEVNPDKYGKVTPGTKIPIISEQEAREKMPDYFLVLPWHFKKMILIKERKNMKKYSYKMIFPLPEVHIV